MKEYTYIFTEQIIKQMSIVALCECEQIDKSLSTREYINAHDINKYNRVNKLLSKLSA